MDWDDIEIEQDELHMLWADFWSRKGTDYENIEPYNPELIFSPSDRKPSYGLLPDMGVTGCTVA